MSRAIKPPAIITLLAQAPSRALSLAARRPNTNDQGQTGNE
jgi:hypothetical protein